VVADSVVRVRLDRLFGVISQSGPCTAPTWVGGSDESKFNDPILATQRLGVFERSSRRIRLIGEDGRGRTTGGQIHRPGVSHDFRLGHAVIRSSALERGQSP
jgi:hypothetical protein